MRRLRYVKIKFFILQTFIWCLVFSLSIQAQTKTSKNSAVSKSVSTCELLKNKKKYDKKEVQIKAVLEIQAETSFLHIEDDCDFYEAITIGKDKSFGSVNNTTDLENYGEAQDLFDDVISESELSSHDRIWYYALQIELVTHGYFYTSNKKKYGHLNAYKNMFLMTKIEKVLSAKVVDVNGKVIKEKNF